MRYRRLPLLLLLAGCVHPPTAGHAQGAEADVRTAAMSFVDAFNHLDWERFSASWADDATAFFPAGVADARVEGRTAIVQRFQAVFADFPVDESDPPYLSIEPRDLQIALLGEAAVVSFHLGDLPTQNRRTLVFANRGGRWLIVHLHASAGRDHGPTGQASGAGHPGLETSSAGSGGFSRRARTTMDRPVP